MVAERQVRLLDLTSGVTMVSTGGVLIKTYFCGNVQNTGIISVPTERKYLPTFAELVDRLSIVILKSVFIPENREAYLQERSDIEADLKLLLGPQPEIARGRLPVGAEEITAIMIIMLCNRFIWENESKARQGGPEQDKLLKLTHSVNGCRNAAKNVISKLHGDRIDLKVDCLAADMPKEFGNWDLFK